MVLVNEKNQSKFIVNLVGFKTDRSLFENLGWEVGQFCRLILFIFILTRIKSLIIQSFE